MILYLDTSAAVKLFIEEASSADVREAVESAAVVNTHLIAYAEACATFARLSRERQNPGFFMEARKQLDRAWNSWNIVAADEILIRRAGDLAQRFGLRGYDSVHLAAQKPTLRSWRARFTSACPAPTPSAAWSRWAWRMRRTSATRKRR